MSANALPVSLRDLADQLGARLVGDGTREVTGVRSLASAASEHIAVYADPRYREEAEESRAGALLVGDESSELPQDQLVVDDPTLGLARLLRHFHPEQRPDPGRHPTAVVSERAEVDGTAHVGPFVVVGAGSVVGAGAVLHAGVVVGRDCSVGEGSILYPRVVVYDRVELGQRVVVHAGAVVGADGFGYAGSDDGPVKVPQVGGVVVDDDVEIGANSAIDRATLDETRIGRGSKLDNLVQVGHNVDVGAGCVLCGQVGVAGSATLGAGVTLGGQSGVGDHVDVGDGVEVAGKSAVLQSVPAGTRVAGIPAVELARWRRQVAVMSRIDELVRRVRALERSLPTGEEDERGGDA